MSFLWWIASCKDPTGGLQDVYYSKTTYGVSVLLLNYITILAQKGTLLVGKMLIYEVKMLTKGYLVGQK